MLDILWNVKLEDAKAVQQILIQIHINEREDLNLKFIAIGMMKNSDIQMAVSNVVKETAKHSNDSATNVTYNNRVTSN